MLTARVGLFVAYIQYISIANIINNKCYQYYPSLEVPCYERQDKNQNDRIDMNEEVVTFIMDNKGSCISSFEKSLKKFSGIDAIQLASSTQAML